MYANELLVFHKKKDPYLDIVLFYELLQALPMVTLMVGQKIDGSTCRVVTLADGADEPHVTDFALPTEGASLTPGKPSWANYVKGVVQHYKGNAWLLHI